jgi:hypothetical protein
VNNPFDVEENYESALEFDLFIQPRRFVILKTIVMIASGLVDRVSGYRSRVSGFDSRCYQIF